MGNYRNFKLVTYFVAHGTEHATREGLQKEIDFFNKYMRLDKVYLEAFRGGNFANEDQTKMVKEVFEANGIEVAGGLTTCINTPEGDKPKQRLFDTFCYNDEKMLATLVKAAKQNGRLFDSYIIDDFYFTNCTCEACRKEHDEYNNLHNITDGSWQDYRTAKMYEVSKKYIIEPTKSVNPDCKITIKYPNWMESYQETGYDPLSQKDIFDNIYTGTETRDPRHQDQHLPRYLSYSLMRYMEDMAPGRNGGGWFDFYDCQVLDYYLEQGYLTAFSKARELMLFCFQGLVDTVDVPALGFYLDKLDDLLDKLGNPIGVPCYVPNASQGEDNLYDYMGMNGFPVYPTPFFPENAPSVFLTATSAYDKDILNKLEKYVAGGGKAIVTNGFVKKLLGKGIEKMTSFRDMGRRVSVHEFLQEPVNSRWGWQTVYSSCDIEFPVLEFRNNSTWGALCKGLREQESFTILARDTYGDGEMKTMVVPDSYSMFNKLPAAVLSKLRKEFAINDIWFEGDAGTSLFAYDNDTFILYTYVTSFANDCDIMIHIKGAKKLEMLNSRYPFPPMDPLYTAGEDAVFKFRARVGAFAGFKIIR